MIRRQTFETPVPSAREAKLAEDALLVLSPHADKTDVVDVAVGAAERRAFDALRIRLHAVG